MNKQRFQFICCTVAAICSGIELKSLEQGMCNMLNVACLVHNMYHGAGSGRVAVADVGGRTMQTPSS